MARGALMGADPPRVVWRPTGGVARLECRLCSGTDVAAKCQPWAAKHCYSTATMDSLGSSHLLTKTLLLLPHAGRGLWQSWLGVRGVSAQQCITSPRHLWEVRLHWSLLALAMQKGLSCYAPMAVQTFLHVFVHGEYTTLRSAASLPHKSCRSWGSCCHCRWRSREQI